MSSQFCDQHHRLLFKILETSKDPNIRSNIVIALGDVAVSFSSIIDENSHELYKGLSDTDLVVKKNTLMVLTHLILNGMIKVKGQLGEMAKCVEDADPRIADLAKLFFKELSTKDNAIYNNLPDGMLLHSYQLFTHAQIYLQSLATFPSETIRWRKRSSRARCGTSSTSLRRCIILFPSCPIAPLTHLQYSRKNKRKTSLRSSASDSACARSLASGAISRSASRCCHLNQNAP